MALVHEKVPYSDKNKLLFHIKSALCTACLSPNRKYHVLKETDIFYRICYDLQMRQNDNICWECKSIITKFLDFKIRTLKAQAQLENIMVKLQMFDTGELKISVNSLSTLQKTICQTDPDFGIQESPTEDYQVINMTPDSNSTMTTQEVIVKEENPYNEDEPDEENPVQDGPYIQCDNQIEANDENNIEDIETLIDATNIRNFKRRMGRKRKSKTDEDLGYNKDNDSSLTGIAETGFAKMNEMEDEGPTNNGDDDYEVYEFIQEDDMQITSRTVTLGELLEYRQQEWKELHTHHNYNLKIKYFCKDCIKCFYFKEVYTNHMSLHEKVPGCISCKICKCQFFDKDLFATHYQNHFRYHSCKLCRFSHSSYSSMVKHWHQTHVLTRCKHCNETFPNPMKLQTHDCPNSSKDQVDDLEKDKIAKEEQVIPKEEQVIPKEEQVIPKEEQIVPKEEQIVPKEEEIVPKEEEIDTENEEFNITENGNVLKDPMEIKCGEYLYLTSCNMTEKVECPVCHKMIKGLYNLKRHAKNNHNVTLTF